MSSIGPHSPAEESPNPYAPPRAEPEAPLFVLGDDLPEAEAIRGLHLSHEASIRSLGSLHYLGAGFGVIGCLALGAVAFGGGMRMPPLLGAAVIAVYAIVAVVNAALGYGLRSLQSWARWTETTFSALGIAFSALCTVAGLAMGILPGVVFYVFCVFFQSYILYLLVSRKGSVVFSEQYKEIIRRTPYLKYQTTLIVKVAVVILVSLVALSAMSALMFGRS